MVRWCGGHPIQGTTRRSLKWATHIARPGDRRFPRGRAPGPWPPESGGSTMGRGGDVAAAATVARESSMSGHESDLEIPGRVRSGVPDRNTEAVMPPVHAPELSARAIADGRTGALDTPSVVHLQALAGNA